ncbi:DUF1127 domain-containing protein [Mangrovicoccus sp. HB161399]|uniref:DUF1127 domain-containing protein n=1 Tax=Mangrovicoccus sp. HB161399 TaxID=2720392 RepID=UPI001C12EA1F|nr:DUF1127 domain-containing protein [Mangrovicoccus sp. HB161399]
MAVFHTNAPRHQTGSALFALIVRGMDAFRQWRENEKARSELYALDDRELDDLGISRYDIRYMSFSHK